MKGLSILFRAQRYAFLAILVCTFNIFGMFSRFLRPAERAAIQAQRTALNSYNQQLDRVSFALARGVSPSAEIGLRDLQANLVSARNTVAQNLRDTLSVPRSIGAGAATAALAAATYDGAPSNDPWQSALAFEQARFGGQVPVNQFSPRQRRNMALFDSAALAERARLSGALENQDAFGRAAAIERQKLAEAMAEPRVASAVNDAQRASAAADVEYAARVQAMNERAAAVAAEQAERERLARVPSPRQRRNMALFDRAALAERARLSGAFENQDAFGRAAAIERQKLAESMPSPQPVVAAEMPVPAPAPTTREAFWHWAKSPIQRAPQFATNLKDRAIQWWQTPSTREPWQQKMARQYANLQERNKQYAQWLGQQEEVPL